MTRSPDFELEAGAQPEQAVRQAALAQLDYALELLATGDAVAVHEARKVCKKLRALLRLIRPLLGRAYRGENQRLRNAGRALAQLRETAVRVQTAETLFGRDKNSLRTLAKRVRAVPGPDPGVSCREAARLLQTTRRGVDTWPIHPLPAVGLLPGLVAGYRRARRGYREARRRPAARLLHEWRKQAKYHGYQCRMLAPLWPRTRRSVAPLKKLSDLLGWHHDLQMLSQTLPERAMRRRISSEQTAATRTALKLGQRLFGLKPPAWLETVAPA